jgi:hypothetical protein
MVPKATIISLTLHGAKILDGEQMRVCKDSCEIRMIRPMQARLLYEEWRQHVVRALLGIELHFVLKGILDIKNIYYFP